MSLNSDGESQVRGMMWSKREEEKLMGWEEHQEHGGVNKADAGRMWREKQGWSTGAQEGSRTKDNTSPRKHIKYKEKEIEIIASISCSMLR